MHSQSDEADALTSSEEEKNDSDNDKVTLSNHLEITRKEPDHKRYLGKCYTLCYIKGEPLFTTGPD